MGVKDFAGVEKLLDRAIGVKPEEEDEAGEDFQNVVFYQQQLYINTGQFDRAAAHVPEILKGIKQYKKINRAGELSIYYNIALCYMMLEHGMRWIKYTEMLIIDKSEVKMDFKYSSMLMQLIAYYETQNYNILTYQLRNTERLMKKREVCGKGEKSFSRCSISCSGRAKPI
jgi:tetratricopeptide (TPR) repeat protein